jgi:hypothetical protein
VTWLSEVRAQIPSEWKRPTQSDLGGLFAGEEEPGDEPRNE